MNNTTFLIACTLIFGSLWLSTTALKASERAALIQSAIDEVGEQMAMAEYLAPKEEEMSTIQRKIRAFKRASPSALAQGRARAKFEKMVKLAERKIIETKRNEVSKMSKSGLAESLATELLHKPGTILTQGEIRLVYKFSGCDEFNNEKPECGDEDKIWRRADGTCNNIEYPLRGAVNTPMRRLIPAQYEDGISSPRGTLQSQGSNFFSGPFSPPLPSPRVVRTEIMKDVPANSTRVTHMFMQWGQFLDHDLDAMPEEEHCSADADACTIDELCAPFKVPVDDNAVETTLVGSNKCHEFHRSTGFCEESDLLKPREHFNVITHFHDGSNVYHHNENIQKDHLRMMDQGMLKTSTRRGDMFMPKTSDSNNPVVACPTPDCFLAGDFRANEQPGLITMHTLWVREHNRVAEILQTAGVCVNSDNTELDEELFQTAREIVTATMQKITYDDYLPIVLGDAYSTLIPPYQGYDSYIDPNIPNVFATAAYRFGHSQIQPVFERLNERLNSVQAGPLHLVDAFFNVPKFEETRLEPPLRGLFTTPMRAMDEFLNNIINNNLFSPDADTPGMDLGARNIQRGRDHGMPSYITWKNWAKRVCNLESDIMNAVTKTHIMAIYGSWNDVDLFVGALSEEPLPGALVGATLACIFGETFRNLRDGDRFFYENPDLFTPEQISTIKSATLSRVICENANNIDEIPLNPFLLQDRVPCNGNTPNGIPTFDVSNWPCRKLEAKKENTDTKVAANTGSKELLGLLQDIMEELQDEAVVSDDADAHDEMGSGIARGYSVDDDGSDDNDPIADGADDSLMDDNELIEQLEKALKQLQK